MLTVGAPMLPQTTRQGVVGHLPGVEHRLRPEFFQHGTQVQAALIGIAAAARPQNAGANGDRVNVFDRDLPEHQISSGCKWQATWWSASTVTSGGSSLAQRSRVSA